MNMRLAISVASLAVLGLSACGGSEAAPPTPASGAPGPSAAAGAEQPAQAPAQDPKPAVKKPVAPVRLDMAMVKALFGSDPYSPKPASAATPETVALGKLLFHEKAVSADGSRSCASCHDLAKYGQDGKATSSAGELQRNAPPVYNAARQYAQFWDARAANVEDAATMHADFDAAGLEGRLKAKPEIVAAFAKAFGDEASVTTANYKTAVGAFVRTLTTKSRFDAFLAGDGKALTNEEKAGLDKFIKVGCTTCHMGRLLGGGLPQKLGLMKPYDGADTGRMLVSKNPAEKHIFKVSPLLNIAETAPYYHDGEFKTLEEAVADMAHRQLSLPKQLDDDEIASIVAFLKALTGSLPDESTK